MQKLWIILIVFTLNLGLSAQSQTNIFIVDSLVGKSTNQIIDYCIKQSIDTILIDFEKNQIDFLLEKNLLATAGNLTIKQYRSSLPANDNSAVLTIRNPYLEIKFDESEKSNLQRTIDLEISPILTFSDGRKKLIPIENMRYEDVLTRADAVCFNNNSPAYARGKIPDEKKSIYKRIIEPAIVVTAAILTVALFFSIRSK